MARLKLTAQKREITGKKVKKLRKQGIIPANVFGKNIKSTVVSLKSNEFLKIYQQTGETEIVDLQIEGEKETRPILIQNLQKNPVTGEPLHVDLRQIILTEKLTAKIPVEIVGESPAVQQKIGILIQPISEIEIEALPTDLPDKFTVDVSTLANVEDEIKIKDLQIPRNKIEIKMDEELVVAKINPLAAEEVAPAPKEEVSEVETKEETPKESQEEGAPATKEENSSQ